MSNLRNAGRQSLIITLNFNRVDDKVNEILNLCSNENTKEKIISFCNDVMSELMRNENCQTSSITVCQNCQTDKIAFTVLQLATLWLTTICLTPLQLTTLQLTKILLMTS